MKKGMVKACAAPAVAAGNANAGGADMSVLYIDMLCERFKDRGIRTVGGANKELYQKLGGRGVRVNAADSRYKSLNINGKSLMTSDDFAAYYRDLRDYKMPHSYSRAESEYEAAKALAEKKVQESGDSPKKLYGLL